MIILLKDLSDDCVDAVIMTKTTTVTEIEECIQNVKAKIEGEWQFEDLVEALPDDCEIHTVWSGDIGLAYY